MSKAFLCILDGLGLGKHDSGDAVFKANAPYLHKLMEENMIAKLKTDGESVGLPSFQTGGSEVGHITIGAGRPIKHLLTKINDQIDSGEFFENAVLQDLFAKAKAKGRIHFLGMTSDGGIHSFQAHLYGLQRMAKQYDISEIYLHTIADGRDVGERTLKGYLEEIEAQGGGKIATIGGRFYGMDRDQNWERTKTYYDAMCDVDGRRGWPSSPLSPETSPSTISQKSWKEELEKYYTETTTSDYYLPPVSLSEEGKVRADDIVIFWNYRADRSRQIAWALGTNDFSTFPGLKTPPPEGMFPLKITKDHFGFFGKDCPCASTAFVFGEGSAANTIGELVSKADKTQLRISETEKFNHVTFYISGERKEPFPGEDRIMVPSPKCASYAEKPEMSAYEQTEKLIEAVNTHEYDLVIQNYANPDLVGHSGDERAAEKAVEVVSACLEKLIPVMQKKGYTTLIIADHGNADEMILPNGEVSASHSKNLVPALLINPPDRGGLGGYKIPGETNGHLSLQEKTGTLSDVAPTLLTILGLPVPEEMTGESFIRI